MDHGSRPALGTAERREEDISNQANPVLSNRRSTSRSSDKRFQFAHPNKLALVGAVLLVGLLVLGWWYFGKLMSGVPSYIDQSKYQYVELTSSRAYYGKVTQVTDKELVMNDVFYVQPTTQSDTKEAAKFELIKLGNDLNGAYDTIVLNRSQITLIENLKDDGTVALKIKEFKSQHKQ